jgi:hypothetical protein
VAVTTAVDIMAAMAGPAGITAVAGQAGILEVTADIMEAAGQAVTMANPIGTVMAAAAAKVATATATAAKITVERIMAARTMAAETTVARAPTVRAPEARDPTAARAVMATAGAEIMEVGAAITGVVTAATEAAAVTVAAREAAKAAASADLRADSTERGALLRPFFCVHGTDHAVSRRHSFVAMDLLHGRLSGLSQSSRQLGGMRR